MSRFVASTINAGSSARAEGAAALAQLVRAAGVALVIAVPLVIIPWGQDAYSRPKVQVLYALTGAMLAAWAVSSILSRRPWHATRGEVALWGWLLAALVSSWTTANPRLTFFGSPSRYEGLLTVVAYASLYLLGTQFFGSAGRVRRLISWIAGAAVTVIAYGIMQLFLPPLFAGEAFTREWYGGLGVLRIPSTVGGPVVFGGYIAFTLPLILALAATGRGVRRWAWLSGGSLAVVALALTQTRAAWLAAVVSIAVFAAGFGWLGVRRQAAVFGSLAVAGVLAGVVLVTVVATPAKVAGRIAESVDLESGSMASRVYIWNRTIDLIRARPLLGWGLETLREIFPYKRDSLVRYFGPRPVIIDRAHNDVLQMAVSIGLPGAAAYLAFWILTLLSGFFARNRQAGDARILASGCLAAVAGYLVQAQFSFSSVAVTPLVLLLSGGVTGWEAAIGRRGESDGDTDTPPAA